MTVKVLSEIAGSVWKVEVGVGDAVTEGQTLIILESMKMEIPVQAPDDGTVARILVAEGEVIAKGQVALELDVS